MLHMQMVDAGDAYFAQQVGNLVAEATASADYVDGKSEKSLQVLRSIAEKEEAVGNGTRCRSLPRERVCTVFVGS